MRRLITFLVFLLPACGPKNALLRCLGHVVGDGASIGPCAAYNVGRFEVGKDVRIGAFNVFRGLSVVALGEDARIGHWNWISAAAVFLDGGTSRGVLRLEPHATIVSRHFIDCSGGVFIHEYAVIGGLRSVFLTHQANYSTATLAAEPITIGAYSLVNACNNLVPGAHVPARCVTTMGAVILPGLQAEGRLYGGVPARDIKAVEGRWFDRPDARLEA